MKCGYDSDIGDLFRELSDQQRLVWAASTALFPRYCKSQYMYLYTLILYFKPHYALSLSHVYTPSIGSIYLPPGRTADENAAYVRSVIRETVRCADGSIPVYGFHWNCEGICMHGLGLSEPHVQACCFVQMYNTGCTNPRIIIF